MAQSFNPMRWAEYALSSTLMIVAIASLTGTEIAMVSVGARRDQTIMVR